MVKRILPVDWVVGSWSGDNCYELANERSFGAWQSCLGRRAEAGQSLALASCVPCAQLSSDLAACSTRQIPFQFKKAVKKVLRLMALSKRQKNQRPQACKGL